MCLRNSHVIILYYNSEHPVLVKYIAKKKLKKAKKKLEKELECVQLTNIIAKKKLKKKLKKELKSVQLVKEKREERSKEWPEGRKTKGERLKEGGVEKTIGSRGT